MEALAITPGDVLVFSWAGDADTDMVRAALEANLSDPAHLEVFDAETLKPIGLTAYLAEGQGIAVDDLNAEATRLDALTGTLVVLSARAFEGDSGTVSVGAGLSLVARFREAQATPTAPLPIETESAVGTLSGAPTKAPKSDARIGGMVAMAVLVFLALFVFFFVWSAG